MITQIFGILVDFAHCLRTVRHTLSATDTHTGLAQARNSPVVAEQKCLAGLGITRIGIDSRKVVIVETSVIVRGNSRCIDCVER